jgi:hypothetical protein
MNLTEYRALPAAQRSLTNWKLMSEADRSAYMEAGGASAAVNKPPIVEATAAVDPTIAATIERVRANYNLATTEAPKDAATAAALQRIGVNYKAASGFDLERRDSW